ncbi:MAG TPA: hypothetical protein VHS74_16965 [Solirubrobacterales bacterium]|jgi:hypothetical protein|nr:hypothetical protein [Solirubrobacterales bacterium]
MRVRNLLATLCVAISSLLPLAPVAGAAPVTLNVRIEGAHETLFEGPLAVEPHGVKATSDTAQRSCDGINSLDPENTVPAPTPTAAAADAMALIGETFDGQWYPGFNDYFIKRFGPDAEKEGKSWGILVNNTFTNVGGCQYQLDGGDEVLWAFNAFDFRPFLALFPAAANYTSGPRQLTATATLGEPFEVEVAAYEDDAEDNPAAGPSRTASSAFAGADVSPVTTSASGFEKVETSDPATVVTNPAGKASITFTTPGWHRIKAAVRGSGEEAAIRSNRLDVCVLGAGETSCGAPPVEDTVRVPPPTPDETGGEGGEGTGGGPDGESPGGEGADGELPIGAVFVQQPPADGGGSNPTTSTSSPSPALGPSKSAPKTGRLRVSVPNLDRGRLRLGRLGVSWKVLEAGPGVTSWTIASQLVGAKKAPFVRRASGTGTTSASLRLPPGATYLLRFTIVDALGRSSDVTIGKVTVPGGGRG